MLHGKFSGSLVFDGGYVRTAVGGGREGTGRLPSRWNLPLETRVRFEKIYILGLYKYILLQLSTLLMFFFFFYIIRVKR